MMMDDQATIKPAFYGYPMPKQAADTGYVVKPGSNPVLRGVPLAIAGWAATTFGFISSFCWSNAGFSYLRDYKELQGFEPRYDPTVVPIVENPRSKFHLKHLNHLVEQRAEQLPNRHYSVSDYHSAYESGNLTPTLVVKALLKLIANSPEHKVAFVTIKSSLVLAAAEASTQRWKVGKALSVIDGVPVAIKDEVDLDGYEKSLGSKQDFTHSGGGTSWCVQKWEQAGAVIIGKLNMHELGLDTTNNNPAKGTPINPYNPKYYTGGSSGGSAYAVSTGLVPITLGADGGGSIRIPSAFCGVYGLKPSHGRVSGFPTPSLAFSCGVLGPLASNMNDLEIGYRIMAAPDPDHPSSSLFPSPIPPTISQPARPKVLGIYRPWFDSADPPVLELCHAALSHYRERGYLVIPITLPYLPQGQLAHSLTILTEISTGTPSVVGLTAANKVLISVGQQTPAGDFLLAQKMRQLLMQHLAHLFRAHAGLVILTPTTPLAGWPIAHGAADLARGCSDANTSLRNMEFIWPANFCGCPALSVPVGLAPATLGGRVPIGLMGMAEWGAEDTLLEWGRVSEEWAWTRESSIGMEKPLAWADVLEAAGKERNDSSG